MRFVITLAATLSCALSSAMAEPEGPLTWDIIQSGAEYYPFEDELNACIAKDIKRRGIGEACINIPHRHCPESIYPDDPPGTFAASQCLAYFDTYWSNRMDRAYAALLAAYRERDVDRDEDDKRAPKLQAYQDLWMKWADTDCDFVYVLQDPYPWIHVERLRCQYRAMAERTVKLENWLKGVEYLGITDHRR